MVWTAPEEWRLRAELAPLPGVEDLAFDVLNSKMTVVFSETNVTSDQLIAAVARIGMSAEPWRDSNQPTAELSGWKRWNRTVMTVASGLFLSAGLISHIATVGWRAAIGGDEGATMPFVARAFYVAGVIAGAWNVAPKGWLAARTTPTRHEPANDRGRSPGPLRSTTGSKRRPWPFCLPCP